MASEFEIVVGTYEQFMLGYKVERTIDAKYVIKQTFATRSHSGSIRAVAACDRFLASAGCDDRVFVYDMNSRKEIQMLMHHKGTVNTIAFTPKASHLMTGSSDGSISIVRTGNWQIEKLWGSAHKQSSVNNVAVHPSGKMALSVGSDYVLRTWNLVKGRHAYATNLASRGIHGRFADTIQFSPTGVLFTITGSKILEIWSITNAEVTDSLEFDSKVVSATWISDTKLVCGLEDGNMSIYEIESKQNKVIKAHNNRVKCIAATKGYIITCDSLGIIKLWSNYDDEDVMEISSTNASCRITCITLIDNKCLKKEVNEEKVIAEIVEPNKNSDSEDDEDNNKDKKEEIPVMRPRREVVIVEEEINEIKIPVGDKKKNKNKKKKPDVDGVFSNKQKTKDGAFVKLNESIENTDFLTENVQKGNLQKKNKLKRKFDNSITEEINNDDVVDEKIKKKSKKDKSNNLEIVEDFMPVEENITEYKISKKDKSKKFKQDSSKSINLEVVEDFMQVVENVTENKISKKNKSKKLKNDSNNSELVEIHNEKTKKEKKKNNKIERESLDLVENVVEHKTKKSKKNESQINSEQVEHSVIKDNKKSKKGKSKKGVHSKITKEDSEEIFKNENDLESVENKKSKKKKSKESDIELQVTEETQSGKKKSKKNKNVDDSGIDSTDADVIQIEETKNIKNKKNKNKHGFRETDDSPNMTEQKISGNVHNKKKKHKKSIA